MATTKRTAGEYTARSIVNRQYPDCVREAPTLYVGALGADALLHFVREVADNCIDEMLQQRAQTCVIQVDSSGTVTVFDDGPGVPFGSTRVVNPLDQTTRTLPVIQAAFGVLNTSGKYRGDAYRGAGGVHGQGAKAVNALSTQFEVWTRHRDNKAKWEYVAFAKGVKTAHVIGTAAPKPPKDPIKNAWPTQGTIVRWTPDLSIVGKGAKISGAELMAWLNIKSYFVPNGTFHVVTPSGAHKTLRQPDGAAAYVRDRFAQLKIESAPDQVFTYTSDTVEVAATWGDYADCAMSAFTNAIANSERGVHFNAFFAALFTALTNYRKKRDTFTALDLRDGCVGLVNARLDAPKFDSQTKEKLVDDRADGPLKAELLDALTKFFSKNKAFATRLCERAQQLKELRARFSADRAVAQALSKQKRGGLPVKASTAPNCRVDEREVLIVEGDSAAGGCRVARNPYYQEMLPLKGKPINALRATPTQFLASEELLSVLTMIGYNPKKEDPLADRRVNKVILLADPDPDGPLHYDTPVRVCVGGTWSNVKIGDMAGPEWDDKPIKVRAWTGEKFETVRATRPVRVCTETTAIHFYAENELHRCTLTHKWAIPNEGRNRSRGEIDAVSGLRMLPASELKNGDRILKPSSDGASLSVSFVTRAKKVTLAAPTPFYCLTVPDHGNFVLASGLVSSNCHINSLILAALFRCTPSLFDEGRVFVVDAPEFYADTSVGVLSGASVDEVKRKCTEAGVKTAVVNHAKGWGEVPADILANFALNPLTRKLKRITLPSQANVDHFVRLMSDDVATRRVLLGI